MRNRHFALSAVALSVSVAFSQAALAELGGSVGVALNGGILGGSVGASASASGGSSLVGGVTNGVGGVVQSGVGLTGSLVQGGSGLVGGVTSASTGLAGELVSTGVSVVGGTVSAGTGVVGGVITTGAGTAHELVEPLVNKAAVLGSPVTLVKGGAERVVGLVPVAQGKVSSLLSELPGIGDLPVTPGTVTGLVHDTAGHLLALVPVAKNKLNTLVGHLSGLGDLTGLPVAPGAVVGLVHNAAGDLLALVPLVKEKVGALVGALPDLSDLPVTPGTVVGLARDGAGRLVALAPVNEVKGVVGELAAVPVALRVVGGLVVSVGETVTELGVNGTVGNAAAVADGVVAPSLALERALMNEVAAPAVIDGSAAVGGAVAALGTAGGAVMALVDGVWSPVTGLGGDVLNLVQTTVPGGGTLGPAVTAMGATALGFVYETVSAVPAVLAGGASALGTAVTDSGVLLGRTVMSTNDGVLVVAGSLKSSLVGSVVTVGDGLLVDAGGAVTTIGTNVAGLTL